MAVSRNTVIGGLSSVFLVPSFVLTVVPTAAYDLAQATAMALAVVLLPCFPFAIRRAHNHVTRIFLVTLGAGLLAYNFGNCLDALNRGHVAAQDVQGRLVELNARGNAIPAHGIATKSTVEAAQRARDAECGTGYARLCRAREDALAAVQRDAAATERAALVEADLDRATAAQTALVPIEATARETASQISRLVSVSSDAILTNRPIFKAFIVEALGGFAPWVMVLIFGTAASPQPRRTKVVKDSVKSWFDVRTEKRPVRRTPTQLYEDYSGWCPRHGLTPVTMTSFGLALTELGAKKVKGKGKLHYVNVGLKSDWDGGQDDRPLPGKPQLKLVGDGAG